MSESGYSRILSTVRKKDFVGRKDELESLLDHATSESGRCLLLGAAPGAGASELLKQGYDELFTAQDEVFPFYFEFRTGDRSAARAANRFLYTFIDQFIAFRLSEPRLIGSFPDVCELSAMARAPEKELVEGLIGSCEADSDLNNEPMTWKRAFGAPLRASTYGIRSFIIIDGLESLLTLRRGEQMLADLVETMERVGGPFVLSGKRRFISELQKRGRIGYAEARKMNLTGLDLKGCTTLIENLSAGSAVTVTPQSRDLMSKLVRGRPWMLRALFESAARSGASLESFRGVAQTYSRLLCDGQIRGYYDRVIDSVCGDAGSRLDLVSLIGQGESPDRYRSLTRVLSECDKGENVDEENALTYLDALEMIRSSSFSVTRASDDHTLTDYCSVITRLEKKKEPPQRVYADVLRLVLKRAPETMARFYRSTSSSRPGELLDLFDCQEVPLSLLDYGIFKQFHKGKDIAEIMRDAGNDLEKVKLPQVYNTAGTGAFYPPLLELIDENASSVGFGFEHAEYTEDNEIVWLAVEIESKMEAEAELASFWCDRMEMAAVMCGFPRFRIWLISREGFTDEALEALSGRSAIGSSRKQVDLLRTFLADGEETAEEDALEAFELIIPLGGDTELIAAHAVEEISRRHGFGSREVNQIKTALVEACINAQEHSLSPDGKISLNIRGGEKAISITVESRGIRFTGRRGAAPEGEAQRRGWGLKLIKALMDDVSFEIVDDGSKITMIKYKPSPVPQKRPDKEPE